MEKSKKRTDAEIVKALKTLLELVLVEGCLQRAKTISNALDLINRLQAEKATWKDYADCLNAENERLKENLNIELENYATEYDNKIKAEAYKEFAELVKQTLAMFNAQELAGVSREYGNRYFYENSKAWTEGSTTARNEAITIVDNLLKEKVGETK